jgi:hypothetical protein
LIYRREYDFRVGFVGYSGLIYFVYTLKELKEYKNELVAISPRFNKLITSTKK